MYLYTQKKICCQGENVTSADNQQERLERQWITGFVDGEGCFHVAINKMSKMTNGYQVLPEFRIVQHQKNIMVLYKLQKYFGGVVRRNNGDRYELRVRGINNLKTVINHFKKYRLITSKAHDFKIFNEILDIMSLGKHLTKDGLKDVVKKASTMNRKRDLSRILRDYTPDQLKETIGRYSPTL